MLTQIGHTVRMPGHQVDSEEVRAGSVLPRASSRVILSPVTCFGVPPDDDSSERGFLSGGVIFCARQGRILGLQDHSLETH